MKKRQVVRLANDIELEFNNGNFTDKVDEIAYKNSVNVILLDINGRIIYTSQMVGNGARIIRTDLAINTKSLIKDVLESKNGKISYTSQFTKYKSQMFVYATLIPKSDVCLVMLDSIDPIDSTISVLQIQLIYVTIISLILSFVISIFISKKLSAPILNMNESAKKLATGNYNVIFEKGDYTEIDNLATTLNYATTELSKTDKLRKELIANVSHDLRTPLTMIKAYSEMIKDLSGNNKEKREEHLQVIIDETDRLTRLIEDMMDLSKLESGVFEIIKKDFNITEKVKNILHGFKSLYEKEGYEFILNANEVVNVNADETKIEQVIYNLLINAVNYSEENKKITINIYDNSENKTVKVEIVDNGCGITKEKLEYIWDRYYKTGEFHKTAKVGTGLGLSIVKNILKKHAGRFGAQSEESKGSTFWFELDK
ncbi:MAG: HAMP domain-containing histidine kinase [Clostridia bacterium]|nr:HAMP domain-containing histidine kinase [Clostridia bacterium]